MAPPNTYETEIFSCKNIAPSEIAITGFTYAYVEIKPIGALLINQT